MSLGQVLFSFTGRINRAKYWLAIILWTVVWIVATTLVVLFVARDALSIADPENMGGADLLRIFLSMGIGVILFGVVVLVPMIISSLAIGIKRLHDRDKSGWWLLVFYAGPWIAEGLRNAIDQELVSMVLIVVQVVIAIWAIIELGFLRGTRGPNQYGPDPLAS